MTNITPSSAVWCVITVCFCVDDFLSESLPMPCHRFPNTCHFTSWAKDWHLHFTYTSWEPQRQFVWHKFTMPMWQRRLWAFIYFLTLKDSSFVILKLSCCEWGRRLQLSFNFIWSQTLIIDEWELWILIFLVVTLFLSSLPKEYFLFSYKRTLENKLFLDESYIS